MFLKLLARGTAVVTVLAFTAALLGSTPLFAKTLPTGFDDGTSCNSILGIKPWYLGITDANCKEIKSPEELGAAGVGIQSYVTKIAINVVSIIFGIGSYVALAFIIMGGFKFITTGGSPEGRASAIKTILNAVIGLVIVLSAAVIVQLVGDVILGAAANNSGVYNAKAGEVIVKILDIAYMLAAAIAVIMGVVAGFNMVTSSSPEKAAKARNTLFYAAIGLVIIIFAAVITNFVEGRL